MAKFTKSDTRAAARRVQAEEKGVSFNCGANVLAPDIVVQKLRQLKLRVTNESYASFAYWKSYRSLSAEERQDVREAVYSANIQ
jgi:hypothetical protein